MTRQEWLSKYGFVMLFSTLFGALQRSNPAAAASEPANKAAAAGSSIEVFTPGVHLLLSENIRTNKTTDLVLQVTAECGITTDVQTVGSDDQTGFAEVRVWVEIDGIPVPVGANDPDRGRVIFANRTYQRTTVFLDPDDVNDSIRTFMDTRCSNGFNWMALNVGMGIHRIEVKAELKTEATARATARAVVGHRTLTIEPVKCANNEAVTDLAV